MSQEPGDLPFTRAAILGLGLMGGSLALALKGKCAWIAGADPDLTTVRRALEKGVVDAASTDPGEILPSADLIVLAAPVRTILKLVRDLDQLHPGPAVIMDLGSTKQEIAAEMENLPGRFEAVGGHPMCGKEKFGLAYADPGLFQGAAFILARLSKTSPRAERLSEELVHSIGGIPVWLDPQIHDLWTGATSHLPYLVANALAGVTPVEAQLLVSTGFRSTARLAGSSPQMMLDILMTNRENVLNGLAQFRTQIDLIMESLANGDEEVLMSLLEHGKATYEVILGGNQ